MLTDQGLAGVDLLPEFLSELQAVNKRGMAGANSSIPLLILY